MHLAFFKYMFLMILPESNLLATNKNAPGNQLATTIALKLPTKLT